VYFDTGVLGAFTDGAQVITVYFEGNDDMFSAEYAVKDKEYAFPIVIGNMPLHLDINGDGEREPVHVDNIYNQNDFDLIPNLPFDISEKAEDNLREKYRTPEIKALIRKLRYYHHVNERKKIIEKKLSERPNYDVSNGIYKRNIFYHSDNSLWGDIDHIYEIKSKEVVKDLEFIYSKLNEKIESIHMLNYIFSYKENKIYREILGIQKNEIFGKYYLESGIQYFKVVVKRNEKMKEIINKIEKYKEL